MFSRIWPLCQGFAWDTLVLLNDSADLAWEEVKYGVIRYGKQIEELTIHLMTPDSLHNELVDLNREGSPTYLGPVIDFGGHPEGECPLCQGFQSTTRS